MRIIACFCHLFLSLCVLFLAALPAYARQCDGALSAGLVGHWKLDETSGAFVDSSGQGNDGTQSGGVSYGSAGILGKAASFDGADDRITISDPVITQAQSASGFAISAWVKVNTGATDERVTVREWDNFNILFDTADGGRFQCLLRDSGSNFYYADSAGSLPLDVWHHVACAYDPTTNEQVIYLNGVESGVTDATIFDTFMHSGTNFGIGNRPGGGTAFDGSIDDVRIYSRALSAKEVERLYRLNAGDIRYNAESSAVEYCDGENWVMSGTGSYSPTAVTFDGTNDYLSKTSDLTGNSDAKTMSGSFWYRTNTPGTNQRLYAPNNGIDMVINTGSGIRIEAYNSALTKILDINSTANSDTDWHHVLFSFDLADTGKRHIYIDNTSSVNSVSTYIDDLIDLTRTTHAIGATTVASSKFNGALADFWFDGGTYIDFSSAAQREKFISPNGAPMYLGADGSLPTGSLPDIFLSGDVDTWHINKGTGGGFTENGELTFSSVNPGSPYAEAPTNGLIAWWKLDEEPGGVAADSSGNGNDASYGSSPISYAGDVGIMGRGVRGMPLNQNSAMRIEYPGFPDGPNDPFTVTGWIKIDADATCSALWNVDAGSHNSGQDVKFVMENSGGGGYEFRLVGDDVTLMTDAPNGSVVKGEWLLVTATYDGTTARIYQNDTELASRATSIDASNNTLAIGSSDGSCASGLPGIYDDWRLYDRALTPSEIAAIYNSAYCSGPAGMIGDIIYNIDEKLMQYCTGKDWVAMAQRSGGTGGGGCVVPAGIAGDLMFNDDWDVMQFCNGEDWVAIGKVAAPTSGLVGYWKLDEASGNFIDSAGSNDGTNNGAVAYRSGGSAKLGYAAGFDGVDDHIVTSDIDYGPGDQITISAWARTPPYSGSIPGGWAYIIQKDRYVGSTPYGLGVSNTTRFMINGTELSGSDATFEAGEWTHVVGVLKGNEAWLYVNGALEDSNAGVTPISNDDPLAIGSSWDTPLNSPWLGEIDEVRIYNRALDAGEVKALYWATR